MPAKPLPPPAAADEVLHSVHTTNLPALFAQLQISLLVTTYQAGKLIVVRNDGNALNTHFLPFAKSMGLAADRGRLSIGEAHTVWEYRNVPAVAQKIPPTGKYDACDLPRHLCITGDIDIHEMAYDGEGELWAVNTHFGCLCTLDAAHSFFPRWRPPCVSAFAPEDRCHLNGLGMVDGHPRCVTALGEESAREVLDLPADVTVPDLEPVLHGFGDLAWAVLQLDLVIIVDTSAAHVAEAWAGRCGPTEGGAGLAWGLDGESTPWYPTMRLFRQPRPGD